MAYNVQGSGGEFEVSQAIDKETHLAIVVATYNEILRPAVAAARECLRGDENLTREVT